MSGTSHGENHDGDAGEAQPEQVQRLCYHTRTKRQDDQRPVLRWHGHPGVLILLGWLHQNVGVIEFRETVTGTLKRSTATSIQSRFVSVPFAKDLRDFYGTDREHEGRLNELSARIKESPSSSLLGHGHGSGAFLA